MRSELITRITTKIAAYTKFAVSSELPWENSGEALYLRNFKRVYVGELETVREPLFQTLSSDTVDYDQLTITAYVTVDAKNDPANLDAVIDAIISAKDVTYSGVYTRNCEHTTEITNDYVVHTFEFTFEKL